MEISALYTGITDFWLASRDHLVENVSFAGRQDVALDSKESVREDAYEKRDVFIQNGYPEKATEDNDQSTVAHNNGEQELTEEEQKEVEELKKRDLEVKRHEQAHYQAAGRYASPPVYEYQTGPDGKRYAVGGKVPIDTSEIPGDPEATLQKARIVKRAALAPEEPSSQDQRVARKADKMALEAQREISESRGEQVASQVDRDAVEASGEKDVTGIRQLDQELQVPSDYTGTNVHRYQVSHLDMANLMYGEQTMQRAYSLYSSSIQSGSTGSHLNLFA